MTRPKPEESCIIAEDRYASFPLYLHGECLKHDLRHAEREIADGCPRNSEDVLPLIRQHFELLPEGAFPRQRKRYEKLLVLYTMMVGMET